MDLHTCHWCAVPDVICGRSVYSSLKLHSGIGVCCEKFLKDIVLPLTQVPEAFIDSLPHCKQPQYLTVISIRIVKLTNQKDLDVSKRCFTDDCCNMFGLLTNSPLPEVSVISAYRFENPKKSDEIKNREQCFLVCTQAL